MERQAKRGRETDIETIELNLTTRLRERLTGGWRDGEKDRWKERWTGIGRDK